MAVYNFTHHVSIDLGTSGCSIAVAYGIVPSNIKVLTAWDDSGVLPGAVTREPTVLLLDPDKRFEQFGIKARNAMLKLNQSDRADDYLLFQKFKKHLSDNPVSS